MLKMRMRSVGVRDIAEIEEVGRNKDLSVWVESL
jgi:hypothetical protein